MQIHGPLSLTGELQRDYNFEVLLVKDLTALPVDLSSDLLAIAKEILNVASLIYISGLIKKITPPTEGLKTLDVDMNVVGNMAIPRTIILKPFDVTFYEDDLGSVNKFFKNYYRMIMCGSKLNFVALDYACLGLVMIKNMNTGLQPLLNVDTNIKIPNTFEYYPRILPIEASAGVMDKGGSGIHEVTVKFVRVPKLLRETVNLVPRGAPAQSITRGEIRAV